MPGNSASIAIEICVNSDGHLYIAEKNAAKLAAALLKQYKALLATEDVSIEFTDDAIERLAQVACEVNEQMENIGARRLHTIMEKLLEDLSFDAPELEEKNVVINADYVNEKLGGIVKNRDLSQFIL